MKNALFSGSDLTRTLDLQEERMSVEIERLSEARVMKTSPSDLRDYFVAKYRVDPLELNTSEIKVDYGDAQVDVRGMSGYVVFDESSPILVGGTRISFFVPFSGDPELFNCRPSTFILNPPRAEVVQSEIVFSYERTAEDAADVRSAFEHDLQRVEENLTRVANEVERFNSTIESKASEQIGARREKLLKVRGIVEDLGFPLKRRKDSPVTYSSPEIKRRITPELPPVSTRPTRPEPTLPMAEYEQILSVISNMVLVMEGSPRAFKSMHEEDLRQHFLVQLNGQYEGQATGETFNYEGKSDILVKSKGKNIFVAECKFWAGPSELRKALSQLQGYTSWRDTKAALLVFNRETAFSTVIQRLPKSVREHPNFKAELGYDSETGFRYVFRHRDDPAREQTITILAFDIPA